MRSKHRCGVWTIISKDAAVLDKVIGCSGPQEEATRLLNKQIYHISTRPVRIAKKGDSNLAELVTEMGSNIVNNEGWL